MTLNSKSLPKGSDQVLREFKKLGDQQKKRYREAVKTIACSDDPGKPGSFRRGVKYAAYYHYHELGRPFFRLLFIR